MPRRSSVNAVELPNKDSLLDALQRSQSLQQQGWREHHHQSLSILTGRSAEEADVQGLTYDVRVDTRKAVGNYRYSDFCAYSSDISEWEVRAAHSRWHLQAPHITQTSISGAGTLHILSPCECYTLPSVPRHQQRLSRSLLFSFPSTSSEVGVLERYLSLSTTSCAEPQSPGRYPQQRLHFNNPDYSPRSATQLSQRLNSLIPWPSVTSVSSAGSARVLSVQSISSDSRSTRGSLSPTPRSSPSQTSSLQRVASRPRVLVTSRPEAVSSLSSSLNTIPSASIVTAEHLLFSNTGLLSKRLSSNLCQHREQQLHQGPRIEAVLPFSRSDQKVTGMGLRHSTCSQESSPKEASSQRPSVEGHRDASQHTPKSSIFPSRQELTPDPSRNEPSDVPCETTKSHAHAAHPTVQGPQVSDAYWVFQRPPNNQRTFYFKEDNLEFSSQFDSGNLIQVERVDAFQYRMYTAMDCGNAPWQTNNRQWFHFSVRGGSKDAIVTICFVGMAHSNMFTYDWMPVMAVVPTRPQYSRITGKAHVEALETMPETPGYPLLVHKPVLKDDADSDRGGDEGNNDVDDGSPATTSTGATGGTAFSISPMSKASGTGTKKKKKNVAMNLTFNFKIEAEISVTYTPPQGRPDAPAIYIASNHPYTYSTLQCNLATWQEEALRSSAMQENSAQVPDYVVLRSISEEGGATESHCRSSLTKAPARSSVKSRKRVGSSKTDNVALSYGGAHSGIYFHREVLCKSLEGRDITLLTISDCSGMTLERAHLISKEDGLPYSSALGQTERPFSFSGKQYVVLTARVHPGECPGSHLMHGCIDFLLNCTDSRAAALRRNFVFYIVPMLNPDGVVRGHSRVDSNGVDLNRMYRDPSPKQHPAPYAVLALLRSLGSHVTLFIDMHAHANKRGTFLYGNSMGWVNQIENLLYAKLVALNTPYLDFRRCNFSEANMFAAGKSGKRKDSSSRVVAFTETGIVHSYTIETSHVMADTLNQVIPMTSCQAEQLDTTLPSPLPVMHSPATFRDTGRAMLLGLLDIKGMNPISRLTFTQFHSTRGLALWLQRQLQIESAEMLFTQAFKKHGKEVQATTSESGDALLAAVMKSLTAEEYPDKITIKGARLLPRTTFSGVRSFVPLETAIMLLLQTAPTGPPRSVLYGSSSGATANGATAGGGTDGKGGGDTQRRGTSPATGINNGNSGPNVIPPAVIATRRRSKPNVTPESTRVEV
nr:unnamed protein product [Leishmania braziliensis]